MSPSARVGFSEQAKTRFVLYHTNTAQHTVVLKPPGHAFRAEFAIEKWLRMQQARSLPT